MAPLAGWVVCAILLLTSLGGRANGNVVEISSAEAFRDAIENPSVDHVTVNRSIALRAYNGWTEPASFPVSMVVEVREEWQGEIVIDVNGMMTMGSVAGLNPDLAIKWDFLDVGSPGLNLTFLRVVIAGARMDEIKQPPTSGISLNIENCTIIANGETGSPQVDLQSLPMIGNEIRPQRPLKNSASSGVMRINEAGECEGLFGNSAAMPCAPKRSFFMKDWGVELNGVGFLKAVSSMLTYRHTLTLKVDADNGIEKALSEVESAVETVVEATLIVSSDLARQDFAPLCPLVLQRNLILRGEKPTATPSTKIHLDDITGCFIVPKGRKLVFRDLIVKNTPPPSSGGPFTLNEFMPFVDVEEGGQFNMDNVVYKNTVGLSAEELTRGFVTRPRMENSGTPGASEQEVQEMASDWCRQTAIENCAGDVDCEEAFRCPDRATFITDVAFDLPGENGTGKVAFHFCNTLIPAMRQYDVQLTQSGDGEKKSGRFIGKKTTMLLVIILACCTFVALSLLAAVHMGFIKGRGKNKEAESDIENCQELGTNKYIRDPSQ
ncbi:hypothetical protein BSKO_05576 [Bryopsis sp. KO-2023]|nr:hypothetical protein BSKO_05576 [Bryopsis sp. KO-2023]